MTIEPKWISKEIAIAIHERQLAEHGGISGVRDAALLESALDRAKNTHAYNSNADICDLAAAYGYGIAKNHAFLDGNKRTALVVTRTFLLLNGYNIEASREEKYTTFINLANGELSEEAFAVWIRKHILKK